LCYLWSIELQQTGSQIGQGWGEAIHRIGGQDRIIWAGFLKNNLNTFL